jgi:hypothetical protein
MRQFFLFFFLIIPSIACAQDTTVRVVGSGSMSDFPLAVSANGEHVAHFSFTPSDGDVNLEITLRETSPDTDSLSTTVVLHENLLKNERSQIDVLIDANGVQVDIKSIVAGKALIVTPVKPRNGRIQPFVFRSKPRIKGKDVPIALLIDSDRDFAENDLMELLTGQDFRLIPERMIRDLKRQAGGFKILTYRLRKLP